MLVFNAHTLTFEPIRGWRTTEARQKVLLRWVSEWQLLDGAFAGMTKGELRHHIGVAPRMIKEGTWYGEVKSPHYPIDAVLDAKSRET